MEQFNDIQAPSTIALEELVLCDAVCNPEYIVEIRKVVTSSMFSIEPNRKIWELIVKRYENHEHIDLPTIHALVDAKYFSTRIAKHIGESDSLSPVHSHANALREEYIKRCAYFNAMRIIQGIDNGQDAQSILSINKSLQDQVTRELRDDSTKSLIDVINDLANELEKGNNPHITTGFRSLDIYTYTGFTPGDLILLAARPSVGKTSIALQMAMAGAKSGKKVTLFSLEMSSKKLAQRLLVGTGHISTYKMVTREMEWAEFDNAARTIGTPNLLINDKSFTLDDICMKISLLCQEGRCDIAYIDYLGLIKLDMGSKMGIVQQISEITRRLKQVAKNCSIPVVLLCQLNRGSAAEHRSPRLYDLRDSGSLEQDADVVMMLERPHEENRAEIDLWLRKNRDGKAGEICIHLKGDDNYSNFVEI